MKIFALIVFLGLVFFFITKKKPEPIVININNASANKNCAAPKDANGNQHHGSNYINGRAYYILELAKENN